MLGNTQFVTKLFKISVDYATYSSFDEYIKFVIEVLASKDYEWILKFPKEIRKALAQVIENSKLYVGTKQEVRQNALDNVLIHCGFDSSC